jgi:PilZ domain
MVVHVNKRRDIRSPVSCAVYYSDGDFHASGMTENLTNRGGCLRGTHDVAVGMELVVLLIPTAQHALMIKKATVRWVGDAHFGVELDEADCDEVDELGEPNVHRQQGPISMMTH